jgi:hypothetical protein
MWLEYTSGCRSADGTYCAQFERDRKAMAFKEKYPTRAVRNCCLPCSRPTLLFALAVQPRLADLRAIYELVEINAINAQSPPSGSRLWQNLSIS